MTINCTECGEQIEAGSEFCHVCLVSVSATPEPRPKLVEPVIVPVPPAPPPAPIPAKSAAPWIAAAFVGGLSIACLGYFVMQNKQPAPSPQVVVVRETPVAPKGGEVTAPNPAPQAPQAVVKPKPLPVTETAPQADEPTETGDEFRWQPANLDPAGDNWVALRSEPGMRGVRLDKLGPEARFRVLARHNGWWKVELSDGRQGWVAARFIGRAP